LTSRSPFHVVGTFSRAIGLPPHAYLESTRIACAREVVRAGMSVVDTALTIGYPDQRQWPNAFGNVECLSTTFSHKDNLVECSSTKNTEMFAFTSTAVGRVTTTRLDSRGPWHWRSVVVVTGTISGISLSQMLSTPSDTGASACIYRVSFSPDDRL
jgi:hypothetical protein